MAKGTHFAYTCSFGLSTSIDIIQQFYFLLGKVRLGWGVVSYRRAEKGPWLCSIWESGPLPVYLTTSKQGTVGKVQLD